MRTHTHIPPEVFVNIYMKKNIDIHIDSSIRNAIAQIQTEEEGGRRREEGRERERHTHKHTRTHTHNHRHGCTHARSQIHM